MGLKFLSCLAVCVVMASIDGRSIRKKSVGLMTPPVAPTLEDMPGIPGQDYPVMRNIPETDFQCSEHISGYYADVKASCQMFHICQDDGRHDKFLCPNGTLFNQNYFICDWWYNVDCSAAPESYVLNKLFRPQLNGRRDRNQKMTGLLEEISVVNTIDYSTIPRTETTPSTYIDYSIPSPSVASDQSVSTEAAREHSVVEEAELYPQNETVQEVDEVSTIDEGTLGSTVEVSSSSGTLTAKINLLVPDMMETSNMELGQSFGLKKMVPKSKEWRFKSVNGIEPPPLLVSNTLKLLASPSVAANTTATEFRTAVVNSQSVAGPKLEDSTIGAVIEAATDVPTAQTADQLHKLDATITHEMTEALTDVALAAAETDAAVETLEEFDPDSTTDSPVKSQTDGNMANSSFITRDESKLNVESTERVTIAQVKATTKDEEELSSTTPFTDQVIDIADMQTTDLSSLLDERADDGQILSEEVVTDIAKDGTDHESSSLTHSVTEDPSSSVVTKSVESVKSIGGLLTDTDNIITHLNSRLATEEPDHREIESTTLALEASAESTTLYFEESANSSTDQSPPTREDGIQQQLPEQERPEDDAAVALFFRTADYGASKESAPNTDSTESVVGSHSNPLTNE